MLTWWIRRSLTAFEKRWHYDTSYMKEVLDEAGVAALLPMNGLQKLSAYRAGVPADVYYAAKLVAGKAADCGPCLQLGISMAQDAGVAPFVIRAIVEGRRGELTADQRHAFDLANAVVARDGGGEAARAALEQKFGKRGLVALAYAMVAAQAFPTLKYALGHGHACVRVKIGDEDVWMAEGAPA